VLEIKPPTASTTFESAPLNQEVPLAPIEVLPESPTAYAPAEEAVAETMPEAAAAEIPAAAPSAPARAVRARRARKTAETTPEASKIADDEDVAETANS
jgi:hypothetical protein